MNGAGPAGTSQPGDDCSMLCPCYTVDLERFRVPCPAFCIDILHQPFPGFLHRFGVDEQPASDHLGVWLVERLVLVEEGASFD